MPMSVTACQARIVTVPMLSIVTVMYVLIDTQHNRLLDAGPAIDVMHHLLCTQNERWRPGKTAWQPDDQGTARGMQQVPGDPRRAGRHFGLSKSRPRGYAQQWHAAHTQTASHAPWAQCISKAYFGMCVNASPDAAATAVPATTSVRLALHAADPAPAKNSIVIASICCLLCWLLYWTSGHHDP